MFYDADIRPHLMTLLNGDHAQPGAYVIEELDMRETIADVVVAGVDLQAFEIKAERDTLRRLPRQVVHYSRLFDRACLVTTTSHRSDAMRIIPEWWGIMIASPPGALAWDRPCTPNPAVDPLALARVLWKHDLLRILKRVGAAHGLSKARWSVVRQRFHEVFPNIDDVRREVRDVIKANEIRRRSPKPTYEALKLQFASSTPPASTLSRP